MPVFKQLRVSDLSDFPYYDKILLYVHDGMIKQNRLAAAAKLAQKHKLDLTQKLEIDVPEGYLHQWLKTIDLRRRVLPFDFTAAMNADVTLPSGDGSNHSNPQLEEWNRAQNLKVLLPIGKPVPLPQFADFPYFDKIHLYMHDTLVKCNLSKNAAIFARKYNVDLQQDLEIDIPEGYFYVWLQSNKESVKRKYQQMNAPAKNILSEFSLVSNTATGKEVVNSEITAFNAKQVGCSALIRAIITCCHSSSCGKFLASAGHEMMVMKFGADSEVTQMEKEHSDIITDVRFKPNSTQLATSSFDKNILVWDATKSCKSVFKLEGHGGKVMSLDFNEIDTSLLCSCDTNNEIRFWNLGDESPCCVCAFQGGNKQVRFRPQDGNLLAAASGNTLNIIDVRTYQILNKLEGHTTDIKSICWDKSGNYVVSVSEDRARMWCVDGKWKQELNSNGYIFESCIFHPRYEDLLIIASHQRLILWKTKENKMSGIIPAHDGVVSSLAHAPAGIIVSGGHDGLLKRWMIEDKSSL